MNTIVILSASEGSIINSHSNSSMIWSMVTELSSSGGFSHLGSLDVRMTVINEQQTNTAKDVSSP